LGILFRPLVAGLVSLCLVACAPLDPEHTEDRYHRELIELEKPDMTCPVHLQSFATGTTPEGHYVFGEVMCYDAVHKPTCLGVVWTLSGTIVRRPTPVECQGYLTNIASETFVLEDHILAMTVRAPDGEHAYLSLANLGTPVLDRAREEAGGSTQAQ
jgi:hypothetical protein